MTKFLVALAVALVLLAACTIIYIEGSSNSVTDTGGHTGTLPAPAQK
ncbi:hypothetical protein [Paraburkholderia sp. EG304]